jgi:serine/threonine-protein kinase
LPDNPPCRLVADGTDQQLTDNETFRDVGIQHNVKITLFPLNVWEQQNNKESVSTKSPPVTEEYQTSPIQKSLIGGLIISTLIVLGLVLTRTSQPSAKQHIPQPSSSTEPSAAPPTPVVSPQPSVAPAPVASPQPFVASRQSPEQFVRDQYSIINNRQYQAAWSRLSTGFQNNPTAFPNGYTSYVNWWNTVKQVDVQSVKRVNTNDKTTTVAIRLKYYMNNGKVSSESRRILLLWNAKTSSWIIQSV